jgi:hypothetical protein
MEWAARFVELSTILCTLLWASEAMACGLDKERTASNESTPASESKDGARAPSSSLPSSSLMIAGPNRISFARDPAWYTSPNALIAPSLEEPMFGSALREAPSVPPAFRRIIYLND